jgi:hypothetical protein
MNLPNKTTVPLSFGLHVRSMSLLSAVKRAEMGGDARLLNSRSPLAASGGVGARELHETQLVLHVPRVRNVSQVGPSVVMSDAVLVVNLPRGPAAGYVEPSQTMGKVAALIDPDLNVPLDEEAAGLATGWSDSAPALDAIEPSEDAGFLIVVKQLAQALRGKIGLSHEALLKLIGQRPAACLALSGLRYSTA